MFASVSDQLGDLSLVQKTALGVCGLALFSYLCLYVKRYYRIWKILRPMPGPFSHGLVGYMPPAYNIFCLAQRRAYSEFSETSTGE